MNETRSTSTAACLAIVVGLTSLVCVAILTGCQQEDATPTLADIPVSTGDSAIIGASLVSEQWTVTFVDTPYTSEMVGAGGGEHYQFAEVGTAEAEGIFVILSVELTNGADDIRMFTRSSGLVITDGQGRETALAKARPHNTLSYNDLERWGEFQNQIFQNPMEGGVTWDGPLVFDVPEDATGLRLHFKGSSESIELGF